VSSVGLLLFVLLFVAAGLIVYAEHGVRKKRQKLRFITMQDKRRYMNLMITATTLLVAGVTGFAVTLIGGGSAKVIELPSAVTEAKAALGEHMNLLPISDATSSTSDDLLESDSTVVASSKRTGTSTITLDIHDDTAKDDTADLEVIVMHGHEELGKVIIHESDERDVKVSVLHTAQE
jgi:predicted PurR-regulated permease PerM